MDRVPHASSLEEEYLLCVKQSDFELEFAWRNDNRVRRISLRYPNKSSTSIMRLVLGTRQRAPMVLRNPCKHGIS